MKNKTIIIILFTVPLIPLKSGLLEAEEPGGIGLAVLQLYDHKGQVPIGHTI